MIDELVQGFDSTVFCELLNEKFTGTFSSVRKRLPVDEDLPWAKAEQLGIVKTLPGSGEANMPLLIVAAELSEGEELRERSSRVKQFKFAKKLLDTAMSSPSPGVDGLISQGLFVFHDDQGNFRLSLVYGKPEGTKLVWSAVRRLSFYVEAGDGNKTFRDRVALPWTTFDKLKDAFSVEKLTKEFYSRLFQWYQWALSDEMGVTYPNDTDTDEDDRQISEHIIRLITRLMFVWFLKQKHLVPDELFDPGKLKNILKTFDPVSGDNYYRAILQNLFFATLNSEIEERAFATQNGDRSEHFDIKTLYRYPTEFALSEAEVLELFKGIPFLNGGLFECLDRGRNYYDGFSRNRNKQAKAPNRLFFDQNEGLIPLLQQYNFTVEENSPGDEEVALDPELLGKVFENLLAAYNPETNVQARKATGSFYTPREIVNYMVDESLIAHLKARCGDEHEDSIRQLFAEGTPPKDAKLRKAMDEALVTAKILDPACGSGAFPMGMLLRMVDALRVLRGIPEDDPVYDLKLELIENCIYGADIQCIAVQISKLRFFISLVCEQKGGADIPVCGKDRQAGIPASPSPENNYGIHALPNLETKFVAANSLIGLPHDGEMLPMQDVEALKKQLWSIRHRHFLARSYQEKKELRKEDRKLRTELAQALEQGGGFDTASAKLMAEWDPYDQNTSASFLDPEWMFNVANGFDIVVGNPPYGAALSNVQKQYFSKEYRYQEYQLDTYLLFLELAVTLAGEHGVVALIIPNTWLSNLFSKKLRRWVFSDLTTVSILHFNTAIFAAVVDTEVVLLVKEKATPEHSVCIRFYRDEGVGQPLHRKQEEWRSRNGGTVNILEKPEHSSLASRLRGKTTLDAVAVITQGTKPFQVGKGKPKQTRKIVDTKPFVSDTQEDASFRPLLRGNRIQRYTILWNDDYWISFGDWLAEPRYSANHDASEKIVIRQTGDSLVATLDTDQFIVRDNLYTIILRDDRMSLKCLLGLINSRLLNWYYQNVINAEVGEALAQVKRGHLAELPICDVHPTFSALEKSVDRVLAAKKTDPSADITTLEAEIDHIVYKLYDLTPEEIAVVEESAGGGRTPDAGRPTAGGRAGRGRGKTDGEKKPKPSSSETTPRRRKPRKRKAKLPPSLPGWD